MICSTTNKKTHVKNNNKATATTTMASIVGLLFATVGVGIVAVSLTTSLFSQSALPLLPVIYVLFDNNNTMDKSEIAVVLVAFTLMALAVSSFLQHWMNSSTTTTQDDAKATPKLLQVLPQLLRLVG